ncbi:MAG: cobalamin biosynthesis protein [Thiohalorhabdaceae bacterium]
MAERLGLAPCYLTESELAAVEAAVGSSPLTAETVGVGSVAEAAALAAAGPGGRLVVERVTSPLATCAAAEGG